MLRRLSRLPIRVRLTLAFATAMVVAFAAVGVFIYVEFEHDQATALDEGLRARLSDIVRSDAPPGPLAELGTAGTPLLTAAERRRAAGGAVLTIARRYVAGTGDVRILAGRAGRR